MRKSPSMIGLSNEDDCNNFEFQRKTAANFDGTLTPKLTTNYQSSAHSLNMKWFKKSCSIDANNVTEMKINLDASS
jgi:hypothetical protein